MRLRKFKIFEGYADVLIHGLSERDVDLALDANNVRANYQQFCDGLGIKMEQLVLPLQKHTDHVMKVVSADGFEQPIDNVDGFVTDQPGVALCVRFADCQPLFMFDPVKKVVAAVHSGWRGNAKNIIGKALRKMKKEFDCEAQNILVAMGPSLGPSCAEFSDPKSELPEFMWKYVDSAKHVDLWACARDQILTEGVLEQNMELAQICTASNTDKFFSYRAEKPKTGRMTGLICLI